MDALKFMTVLCLYIYCMVVFSSCTEPHCSKFHYEERILEKVIRLEFSLDRITHGYKEIKAEILEEKKKFQKLGEEMLNKLHTETEKMGEILKKSITESSTKLVAMEADVQGVKEKLLSDFGDVKSTVETSLQETEAKLGRLSGDLHVFQTKFVDNITALTKTPDVFFRAKDLADLSVSANVILKFKTTVENRGGGYNPTDGTFTAPVDGHYLFTAQLCQSGGYSYPSFIVEGVEQRTMTIASSLTSCGTMTHITNLKMAARVAVRIKSSSTFYDDGYRWNTFSGFLLRHHRPL